MADHHGSSPRVCQDPTTAPRCAAATTTNYARSYGLRKTSVKKLLNVSWNVVDDFSGSQMAEESSGMQSTVDICVDVFTHAAAASSL